jgi:hypothetical protein
VADHLVSQVLQLHFNPSGLVAKLPWLSTKSEIQFSYVWATLTARGVHATMHVYGYMHVCVSWALGWIRKDEMKKKGLLSLKGTCPKTGLRTSNQVSLSTALPLLCDFANLLLRNMASLSFHLHGAGVAPFGLVPWWLGDMYYRI